MAGEYSPASSSTDAGWPARVVATALVFFTTGFGMAAWAPLVPFAKARAGIDDATLGILLLCLGVGSIIAMPIAGAGAARYGCRVVLIVSTALMGAGLLLLSVFASLLLLVPAMLVFGAGVGSCDVAMNMQAIVVERAAGRAIMSRFHGMFSLGGIVGAGGVATLLGAGLSPVAAASCVAAAVAIALALAIPNLLSEAGGAAGPVFAVPRGVVLLIGALCFVSFLTEGAILDWSAVFLTSVKGADMRLAGLGYAVFSVTMTVGRLAGDRAVERFGGSGMVAFGGVSAALGLVVAILPLSWQVSLVGYALVGLGCANIVPVLFTSVGRQTAMPDHLAVPAIVTLGYAGILAGPAAIGFVSRVISLSGAFLILAVMLLVVAAAGRKLHT
jgi:predicted MFS family arabinose efflux permease